MRAHRVKRFLRLLDAAVMNRVDWRIWRSPDPATSVLSPRGIALTANNAAGIGLVRLDCCGGER
jgi:hypothetical protein